MTDFPPARGGARELIAGISFDDFEVSWGGPTLSTDRLCFGSEDGKILITDLDGGRLDAPRQANYSGEAINGVAFLGRFMAVSSRNEIMLFTLQGQGEKTPVAPIQFGAHGVIASASGYFFAPLGRNGLLFSRPKVGKEQSITVSSSLADQLYFYRAIHLQDGNTEVVACATRRDGVAAMEFRGEDGQHHVSTLTFGGLDVIDLCPLNYDSAPRAAAALGRDGTIILFRDVLRDQRPVTVKYEGIRGTAYQIVSARGYLFVLTSRAMYVIADLVSLVLDGGPPDRVTPFLPLPMTAVDTNLVGDRWVLAVTTDGVLRFDVELLEAHTPTSLTPGDRQPLQRQEEQPVILKPDWARREVEQNARVLGLSA